MNIKSQISNSDGTLTDIVYTDTDSFDTLDTTLVRQVYAVCFLNGEMLIVFNNKRKAWGLVGGSLEAGESYEDCLKREIIEESNMRVKDFKPVGYQQVTTPKGTIYQLRYVCTVEPMGPFVSDPAQHITEIKFVSPQIYKEYFDWGDIGQRIIDRAGEILPDLR